MNFLIRESRNRGVRTCKTTKRVEWDSSVTWRSTWFDWSSYLIWLNITGGKPAFYRQLAEHHTAEFQLGTIYVRSTPQMGSINPSLWEPFTPHYMVPSTPHYEGPSTPHYETEQATTIKLSWWNVLANKRSSMPQTLPQAMPQVMPWWSCPGTFHLTHPLSFYWLCKSWTIHYYNHPWGHLPKSRRVCVYVSHTEFDWLC